MILLVVMLLDRFTLVLAVKRILLFCKQKTGQIKPT